MPSSQTYEPDLPLSSDLWASSSSSDQYTSDSDSDSPRPRLSKPLTGHPRAEDFTWTQRTSYVDRTPRKLRKARECLFHSLLCAFSLCPLYDSKSKNGRRKASRRVKTALEAIQHPWVGLSERILLLRGYTVDPTVSDKSFRACLDVFIHLCSTHILPLTRDRPYIRDELSRSEAKPIPGFSKHFHDLVESCRRNGVSTEDRWKTEMVLESCPLEVLVRVAGIALPTAQDRVNVLDLSDLPVDSPQIALDFMDRQLNLCKLLEVFGIGPESVTQLLLNDNDLEHLPKWVVSLRNIEHLRISGNPKLEHLPFFLLKMDNLRRIDAEQVPAISSTSTMIILDGRPRDVCRRARRRCVPRTAQTLERSRSEPGVKSLVEITVIKAINTFESDSTFWDLVDTLGSNLKATIESYIRCEWCDSICLRASPEQLELRYDLRGASIATAPQNGVWMMFKGSVCGPCRCILTSDAIR